MSKQGSVSRCHCCRRPRRTSPPVRTGGRQSNRTPRRRNEAVVYSGETAAVGAGLSNWDAGARTTSAVLLNLITSEKPTGADPRDRGQDRDCCYQSDQNHGSDTGGFGENVHRMARIDSKTGVVMWGARHHPAVDSRRPHSHLDALATTRGR